MVVRENERQSVSDWVTKTQAIHGLLPTENQMRFWSKAISITANCACAEQ